MKEYIVNYWDDGGKYTMVVGSTSLQALRDMCKQQWNRFTVEEV
jgi:hypothetical protein